MRLFELLQFRSAHHFMWFCMSILFFAPPLMPGIEGWRIRRVFPLAIASVFSGLLAMLFLGVSQEAAQKEAAGTLDNIVYSVDCIWWNKWVAYAHLGFALLWIILAIHARRERQRERSRWLREY